MECRQSTTGGRHDAPGGIHPGASDRLRPLPANGITPPLHAKPQSCCEERTALAGHPVTVRFDLTGETG